MPEVISPSRTARTALRRGAFVGLAFVLFAACGTDPQPEPQFSDPEYEGLSREEIERQAEAMTPQQAESLGIVDTTIRIEAPMNPDSVLPTPVDTADPR